MGGCSGSLFQSHQTFYTDQADLFRANYSTFDHAFTDAGLAEAHRQAQRQCSERKRVADKTSNACSLTLCTTSFQCMEPAEAAEFRPDGKP